MAQPGEQAAKQGTSLPTNRTCPSCNTPNALTAKFCKGCGERLHASAEVPPPPPPPVQIKAASRTTPTKPFSPIQATPVASKKGSKSIFAGVAALALATAIGGGGYYWYLYRSGTFIGPVELASSVNAALVAKGVQGISAEVGSDRGVTLIGIADDVATKDAAVQIARSLKGVKAVVDKLSVLPSIGDTENRLSQALKDLPLPSVMAKIDEKRNATLTGEVDQAAMIDDAKKIATQTLGVKSVVSQIVVVEIPQATPIAESPPVPTSQPVSVLSPLPKPKPSLPSAPPPVRIPASIATPTQIPALPPVAVQIPAVVPEQQQATCDGLSGFNKLTCKIEGAKNYFKCAPDGRHWDNAIPGCTRTATSNTR